MPATIVAESPTKLRALVARAIEDNGPNCDLNHLDVSRVTAFNDLFKDSPFNGDISRWDVSRAHSMASMFQNSLFNGDISGWDVGSLNKANLMFMDSAFSGDVSKWRAMDMAITDRMFATPAFHGDLSQWELRTYCQGQHMVLPTFNGVLPSVQWADHFSCYTVLIGGVDALNLHLRRTPFSRAHADCLLWDEEKSSVWATPQMLRWAREQKSIGAVMGLDHEGIRDLMLATHCPKPSMDLALPDDAFEPFAQ